MDLISKIFWVNLFFSCCFTLGATNSISGRIAGGYEARPHSNPYVVSLHKRYLWMRYRICTGSILSQRWILSAGHCVTDSAAKRLPMDAIVGAHSLAAITSSQIYPISYRVAHPMYRGNVGPYDIAMMKTAQRMEYSRYVQPIRLPTTNFQFNRHNKLLITGWGALQSTYFYTVLPNKLQEVEVTYLPYNECYRAVDKLKEGYEPNPLRRMANLCTGPIYGGIAGCTGDSGGPLVQYVAYATTEETIPAITNGLTEKEETTVASSSKPIYMTTDRPSTTSIGSTYSPCPITTDKTSTTTTGTTYSPITMTTDRPTMTTGSTASPISMTTDRPTMTTGSTTSPIPMTTDRPTMTTGSTTSPIPMTTDRPTMITGSTASPIPMTTDRPTMITGSTASPIPMTTDRPTMITGSTVSPIPMTTDRPTSAGNTPSPIPMTTDRPSTTENSASSIPLSTDTTLITSDINYGRSFEIKMVPIVIGVISWGVVPCGKKGAPTVYSNVTNYLDFIDYYLNK